MQDVARRINRLARAGRTILLSGDTGTGKELVAKTLHDRSSRKARPFVTVNCGGLPQHVLESELFGHTRGAFTGASSERRGLLRLAHRGTLLLDEINSMSLDAQGRLLRFLESGELRAVGSDSASKVDAWIIAATNVDLSVAAEQGSFRKDLMYRLDYLRLHLPPLSERGGDVTLLAKHFLRNIAGDSRRFSDKALLAITSYEWPGNVRELRNRVEAAALMADGQEITPEALELSQASPGVQGAPAHSPTLDARRPLPPALEAPLGSSEPELSDHLWDLVQQSGMSLGEAVAFCESLLIQRALDREENNRTRAAQRLGIHVRTIFKKLGPAQRRNSPGLRATRPLPEEEQSRTRSA